MSNFVVTDHGIVLNRTAAACGRVPLAAWDLGSAPETRFLSTKAGLPEQGAVDSESSAQDLQGTVYIPRLLPNASRKNFRDCMTIKITTNLSQAA